MGRDPAILKIKSTSDAICIDDLTGKVEMRGDPRLTRFSKKLTCIDSSSTHKFISRTTLDDFDKESFFPDFYPLFSCLSREASIFSSASLYTFFIHTRYELLRRACCFDKCLEKLSLWVITHQLHKSCLKCVYVAEYHTTPKGMSGADLLVCTPGRESKYCWATDTKMSKYHPSFDFYCSSLYRERGIVVAVSLELTDEIE